MNAASIKDGTVLINLAVLSYSGTPDSFSISWYAYNEAKYYIRDDTNYICGQRPYNDERKYLCITLRGKVKIRRGSQFSQVLNGTKMSMLVLVMDSKGNLLNACTLTYYKGYKAVLTQPQSTTTNATKAPTTITATTTTTTNTATTQTTTQTSKRTERITVRETTQHIETIRSTESVVSSTPTESTLHSSNPKISPTKPNPSSLTETKEPCWEENNLRKKLLACKPQTIELYTPVVSAFRYWLNVSMEDTPFIKISHIFVRTFGVTIVKNTKLDIKIYASDGEREILLKDVNLKIKNEATRLDVSSMIPRNSTYLSVKIQKGVVDISGPPHIVSMFVSTYGFCSKPDCLHHYSTWMANFSRQSCVDKSQPIGSPIADPVASFSSCFGKFSISVIGKVGLYRISTGGREWFSMPARFNNTYKCTEI